MHRIEGMKGDIKRTIKDRTGYQTLLDNFFFAPKSIFSVNIYEHFLATSVYDSVKCATPLLQNILKYALD